MIQCPLFCEGIAILGYLFILLSIAFVAVASVFTKMLTETIDQWQFLFGMFVTGFLGLTAIDGVLALTGKPFPKASWNHLATTAGFDFFLHCVLVVGGWIAFFLALEDGAVGVVALLGRAESIVLIFLSAWFFSDRLTVMQWTGAAIAICGTIYLKWVDVGGLWNVRTLYIIVFCFSFSSSDIFAKRALAVFGPREFTALRNLLLVVASGVLLFIWGDGMNLSARDWALVGGVGICGPAFARLFYMYAMERISLSVCSVVSQLEPFMTIGVAALVLGNSLSDREWLSGVVIVIGCAIAMFGARRSTPSLEGAT